MFFEMNKRENPDKLAPAEPLPIDTSEEKLSFRTFRRRVVDQIMSNEAYKPNGRLMGESIAQHLNQKTRVTRAATSTLGRAVDLKPDEAQDGLDQLIAARQVHVHFTEKGHRVISLVLLPFI
jgi:hypothetical protein